MPLDQWDDSLRHVIDDMHGRPINIHSLMANHPQLLNAWWNLRMYLVNGGDLGQRHCELVILRIAVHMRSWYEWASHVVRGLDSGLTLEEIDGLRSDAGEWDAADAALLQAVDEIVADNVISRPTRDLLADHFTARQIMDVIMLHGMYRSIACMINTWGLELDGHVRDRLPAGYSETSFSAQ